MGLKKCQYTRIGVPGVEKSLSGGESKRLAFATEVSVRCYVVESFLQAFPRNCTG